MSILYLVRHGRTSTSPLDPSNPGLSPAGREQALAVAQELSARLLRPIAILASPLSRCRETAEALCDLWGQAPLLEPRVAEIPAPDEPSLRRDEWLRTTLALSWSEVAREGERIERGYSMRVSQWRKGVCEAALACRTDTVIFSHFVPINVLAGEALNQQTVTCFQPDYASVTIFETMGDRIRLVERGREGHSRPV